MKSKLILSLAIICAFIPLTTHGADFVGLVGIPGLDNLNGNNSLEVYINTLYRLSISLAALLAVVKIVAAGAKYMLSDIVTHKEDAKKDIQGALIGLLIVIGAIIILNTINSDLTELNLTVPVQEVTQGERVEKAIYDAVTEACDRPGRASECETLTCEGWFTNGMEILPGEDEISACRRTCLKDYQGAFDPKLFSPRSSTCRYDPEVAKQCDLNSSWNCCEDIRKAGTWNTRVQMCNSPENPFTETQCSENGSMLLDACRTVELNCGADYIKTAPVKDNGRDTGTSIVACSNPEAIAVVEEGQSVIDDSVFTPMVEEYDIDMFNSNFDTSISSLDEIKGKTTISAEAIANANLRNPTSDELIEVADNLMSKCSGSRVVYGVGLTDDNGANYDFYCIE